MKNIHYFISEEDCEQFFTRMAKNNGEELSPAFVFEGNTGMDYAWVIALANIVGCENLGVLCKDYEDELVDFIDEFFIKPARLVNAPDGVHGVDIEADSVFLAPDGSIHLWWD